LMGSLADAGEPTAARPASGWHGRRRAVAGICEAFDRI